MSEQIAWLESSRGYIKEDLKCIASNFIKLGFHLWEVQSNEYYKEDGYESVHEFAEVEFGIKKSTCYNYIALMENFSRDGRSVFLDDKWQKYNYSQLVEMVSMQDFELEKVNPDMSVKQIREIKKHGFVVVESLMKRELQEYVNAYYDKELTRKAFKDFLEEEFRHWHGQSGGNHIDYTFSGSVAKIGTYRYPKNCLLDLVDKYVGLLEDIEDVPEEDFEDITESVQTSGTEDIKVAEPVVPWKTQKHSETYELNHDDTLSDALMNILTGHIKNVDKVTALIDFIDSEIKYCMWNSSESRRLE